MRELYASRRQALLDALERELGDRVRVAGVPAGLDLVAELAPGIDDEALAGRLGRAGIEVAPLSRQAIVHPRPGLILGFAAVSERRLARGVSAMRPLVAKAGLTGDV
jgi:GntR family transcriptional regulator/MocR family aminotransferase